MDKERGMSDSAKITVRVTSSSSASTVGITSAGRYKGTNVNSVRVNLTGEPVYTNASAKAFWTSVLTTVQAYIATLP